MPVRSFGKDGSGRLRFSIGKADPAGAFTVAALVQVATGNSERVFERLHTFAEEKAANWSQPQLATDANGLRFEPGAHSGFAPPHDGRWQLVVFVRTASGAKCKYFIFDFKTQAWTVKEDTEVSNIAHVEAAGGCQMFGSGIENVNPGVRAAVAVFNTAFTQAEAEALKALPSLEDWLTKSPLALWLFNQAGVSEPVNDLTGGGANQVERNGTVVLAEEPPIPYTTSSTKPENIEAPVLSGTPTVGEELSVTTGKWVNNPTQFTYRWQEAQKATGPWVTIAGATASTLTVTSPQNNRFIRCVVKASNAAGSGEANSNVLGPVERSEDEIEGNEHGFPDWQQFPEYQPEPEYVNPELKLEATKTIGTFFVAQVPALDLYFRQTSGSRQFVVAVQFHDRLAVEPVTVNRSFILHPENGLLRIQVPCEARYATVIVEPVSGLNASTFEVRIMRTLTVVAAGRFGSATPLQEHGLEVPKEGTLTKTMTETVPGTARLALSATGEGTGRTVEIQRLNELGEWIRYLKIVLPEKGAGAVYLIDLPNAPVRFVLGNTTAAAITVDLVVGIG